MVRAAPDLSLAAALAAVGLLFAAASGLIGWLARRAEAAAAERLRRIAR